MAFKSLVGSGADCSGGNSLQSFVKQLDRHHAVEQDLMRPGQGSNSGDVEGFVPRGRMAELDDRGFAEEFLEARPSGARRQMFHEGPPPLGLGRLEEVLARQGPSAGMSKEWAGDFESFHYAGGNEGSVDFEAAFRSANSRPNSDWSQEFHQRGGDPNLVHGEERQAFEQAFARHHDHDLDQAFTREFAAVLQNNVLTGKGKQAEVVGDGEEHVAWEEEFAKNFSADPDFGKLEDLFKQFDISTANNSTVRDWEDDYGNFDYDEPEPLGEADPVIAPCAPYLFESDNPYVEHEDPLAEAHRLLNSGQELSYTALALEAAVQRDPENSLAWSLLGSTQAENEKEGPAIAALQRAVQIDPKNLDALMALAVSYTNESLEREAYATLERWVTTQYPSIPRTAGAVNQTTQAYHQQVTDLFLQAARQGPLSAASPITTPMDPSVQTGLGVLFYNSGDYAKAIDCFTSALSSSPEDYLLWNRLGATLANSGRSEEAIDAYYKALELKPRFVRARYNLGVSCINVGCYKEAVEHLLGALSMHRDGEEKGSANLWETLKRGFMLMDRRDLADKAYLGQDVNIFRDEFEI
ncbi:hypothetical protein PhCBS80983_g02774 [Powellomyces hirtus]|uniref:Peroxin-5 n=1 Tax=Powellomyces hirtus TaxID=109895 RepID=A0A507E6E5_9FUNG|nr:hypothetical protein PhCBS80983_g02774 [Powellomyces hirtus]